MLPLLLCFTSVVLFCSCGPVKCLFYIPDNFTSKSNASRFSCSFLCISSSYKIFLTSWSIQMHADDMYHDVSSTLVLIPRLHKNTSIMFHIQTIHVNITQSNHDKNNTCSIHEHLLYASGASTLGIVKE